MKKYAPLVAVAVLVIPSVAFAAWWNPFTWFQSSNTDLTQPVQQRTAEQSATENSTNITTNLGNIASSVPVSTTQVTGQTTTKNNSQLQSEINVLTVNNNSLQSKLANIESQLTAAQKNYVTCESNLAAAQNTNTNTQSQQVTPPPTPVAVSATASISLDFWTPASKSFSATSGQYLNLPVVIFDIAPSSDGQILKSLSVNLNTSGQGGVNTAYLYVGGMGPIATALVSNGNVNFTDIQNIPSLSVHPTPYDVFTVKIDVFGLKDPGDSESVAATVSSATIVDANKNSVNVSGTAQGKVMSVTE